MKRTTVVGGLLPLLLLGTAGTSSAQDVFPPVFTMTGSGGISAFDLADFDTGAFGHTDGGTLFGGVLGANITAGVARTENFDVLVSLSGFGAFGASSSSWTDTFDGTEGGVIVTGLSTPDAGTITLDPVAGTANVTGNVGFAANVAVGAGATGAAVTPDGSGFVFAAASSGPGTATAAGGIADDAGSVVVVDGPASVTTEVSRSIAYGGADLTMGLAGRVGSTTSLQAYAGPSFRGLGQSITTEVSLNVPESPGAALTIPVATIAVADTLSSQYYGGVVGGNLSIVTDPGMLVTLGLEGGVYSVHADWTGQTAGSICCGASGTPLTTTLDPLSVQSSAQTFDFVSDIAYTARGSGAVTWVLDPNRSFTLGGSAEYLSKVATVNHSNLTQIGDNDWVATDGTPTTTAFSWTDMWNFTVSGSLTGRF